MYFVHPYLAKQYVLTFEFTNRVRIVNFLKLYLKVFAASNKCLTEYQTLAFDVCCIPRVRITQWLLFGLMCRYSHTIVSSTALALHLAMLPTGVQIHPPPWTFRVTEVSREVQ